MSNTASKSNNRVKGVGQTGNVISDRAGINTFVRYIGRINIIILMSFFFKFLRKNSKGASVENILFQIICNQALGDSRHLVYFDHLKEDKGYAAALETKQDNLISSHTVKRFYNSISSKMLILFRVVLLRLFIWRLHISNPDIIILNLDVMPMDNNDAKKREGVNYTYKKVFGFAPIQMTWGKFIIDSIFRSGEKHSNHEDDAIKMIRRVVERIKSKYNHNTPIIIRMDSGYFDQKLFNAMEEIGIGYIVGGVFFPDIKHFLGNIPHKEFKPHFGKKDEDIWEYFEFGDCRKSWSNKKFRRAIFYRSIFEENRCLLPGTRPGTCVYTNLGMGQIIDDQLKQIDHDHLFLPEEVIRSYQQRGTDELVHRSLKEFGFEQLPFQNFTSNASVYYMMAISFFLYESFKEDVTDPVIPVSATPTTLRRKLFDIAGHFIKTGGKIILNVTESTMNALNFKELWERCIKPPPIAWA